MPETWLAFPGEGAILGVHEFPGPPVHGFRARANGLALAELQELPTDVLWAVRDAARCEGSDPRSSLQRR